MTDEARSTSAWRNRLTQKPLVTGVLEFPLWAMSTRSGPAQINECIIIITIIIYRKLHAVYITIDGSHYLGQKAQTAILQEVEEQQEQQEQQREQE